MKVCCIVHSDPYVNSTQIHLPEISKASDLLFDYPLPLCTLFQMTVHRSPNHCHFIYFSCSFLAENSPFQQFS